MNPYEKIIGLIEDSKKNMNMAHPYNNSNNNLPPMKEKEKKATIDFLKRLEVGELPEYEKMEYKMKIFEDHNKINIEYKLKKNGNIETIKIAEDKER